MENIQTGAGRRVKNDPRELYSDPNAAAKNRYAESGCA
jgi:hypothetical protein